MRIVKRDDKFVVEDDSGSKQSLSDCESASITFLALRIGDIVKEYPNFDFQISQDDQEKFINEFNTQFLIRNPNVILIEFDSKFNSNQNELKTFHDGDSGLDLHCPETIVIPAKSNTTIDLGVKCQAVTSFWLVPRSSIGKTPLRMANSIGLVDKGYRGSLKAMVDNISEKDYTVQKGDRLFQIAFPDLTPIRVVITRFLGTTSRSTGGFGSTGK